MEWGGVLVQLLGGQGARAHVILVLRECIWNATTLLLVLPAFEDIGSLPRQVVYPPGFMAAPWMTTFHFLVGNREAELKPTTFSSLLLFCDFLSFLFS